jgi:hypothetical protein
VSPNTVRRILKEADLWPEATRPEKKAPDRARTADLPGQTLNIDLCFVPATHEATTQKLPAVSGSSGHLVVEHPCDPLQEKSWPEQIFEDEELEYSETMLAFVEASQSDPVSPDSGPPTEAKRETELAAQKRDLRAEEAQLRAQRRRIRQQRRQEDDTWRTMNQLYHTMSTTQDAALSEDKEFVKNAQRALRQHRKRTCAQRHAEDHRWRQQRQSLRTRWRGHL